MKKYFFILIVFVCFSCIRERKCNIIPITLEEMNTKKIKGDFIFKSENGKIDTLLLIDDYDILNNKEIKSPTNYVRCNHSIGFDYLSKNKNGIIKISLKKNEDKEYTFSVVGFCIDKDFKMTENEVVKDSLFIIKVNSCENSNFKELAFRRFNIEYFITQNGDVWKPIKFIPKK
ncbi:hypothetical protein [Flavobacterium aestuarii]|uniref:hypothetical protein n=1 Tax=Flavobacterium aestuarii TaxID=3149227 RepID=UPI0032B371DB